MYLHALSWLLLFFSFLDHPPQTCNGNHCTVVPLYSAFGFLNEIITQGEMCVPHKCVFPGFLLVTVK